MTYHTHEELISDFTMITENYENYAELFEIGRSIKDQVLQGYCVIRLKTIIMYRGG